MRTPCRSCSSQRRSGLGQEVNSCPSRLSGVTVAPAVVIVLQNRRRKRPIRRRLENNRMRIRGVLFLWRRGGARGRRAVVGKRPRGWGVRGGRGTQRKQDVLGSASYLLPLPPSRSSSYLRWSRSWPSFPCWLHSPGAASSARSAQSPTRRARRYCPGSVTQV